LFHSCTTIVPQLRNKKRLPTDDAIARPSKEKTFPLFSLLGISIFHTFAAS
jgi:hypothetical protein